jgi:hypothetical protein
VNSANPKYKSVYQTPPNLHCTILIWVGMPRQVQEAMERLALGKSKGSFEKNGAMTIPILPLHLAN